MTRIIYRAIALFMPLIFFITGLFSKKMREGWSMRRGAGWLNGEAGTQPIWIHCASGEFEYAKPVIRAIKQRHLQTRVMVTYFSPSVKKSVESSTDIDLALPAPWENPKLLREFIAFHKPRALLIARTDAWPEMTYQARRAGVPSLLFSATLVTSSSRLKWPTRLLTRLSLEDLTQVYCVTDNDADVFNSLGVGFKTQVAGDTRFDQTLFRLENAKSLRLEVFDSGRPKIVCGSTWPEDERELFKAMRYLKSDVSRPQWVVVPHEPTAEHIAPLLVQISALGLKAGLYSVLGDASSDVVIVDRIGILAELYQLAAVAFVGGSFRKTVHSVMEPLAAGCSTFVGPYYQNNREAIEFHLIGHVHAERDGESMGRDLRELLSESETARAARRAQITNDVRAKAGRSAQVADWVEAHGF